MDEQIKKLANARDTLEEAKINRTALLAQVTDSPEYAGLTSIIEQTQAAIAEVTRELQSAALDAYAVTGSKKPHPAIGVRVNTQVVYDPDKALEWSRSNLLAAVTLDRKMFEAHAKAVAKTQPLEFVALVQVPSITIASDLSTYIEDIEEKAGYEAWVKEQDEQDARNDPTNPAYVPFYEAE
jgi:hypothetical protein